MSDQFRYSDYIELRDGAAPPVAPYAGKSRIYVDADAAVHVLQADGTDSILESSAPGSAKTVRIVLIANATAVTLAEDFAGYDLVVGADMDGLSLTSISWFVATGSSSGLPSFAVRKNAATEMLSTNCTLDVNERTSDTAATPPVINAANAEVATGDVLHFDCDAAGTGTLGSEVRMTFS